MTTKLKFNKLTYEQTSLLIQFIKEVFPEKEDETFYQYNELKFAGTTIHRLFKKHFGYGVSMRNVLFALEKLHYVIYLKKGEEITVKAEKQTDKKEKPDYSVDLYKELDVDAIYVKIDSRKMHNFIRAAYDLPPVAKEDKIKYRELVIEEIDNFKNTHEMPPIVPE